MIDRPLSILCIASKLLEKAVYVQLEAYLIEQGLLYELQSGFRKSFSTDTCLIHLGDYIREQMSLGFYTGMVLLDLQKAFDTVDHVILCKKLKTMGVNSYLGERKQIVCVNGNESEPLTVSCGVPQGSILGPLLILCYVNDMAGCVDCKLLLYADDSALLVSGKDPNVISTALGKNLDICQKWLVDNKLSLHLGKTESILFGTKRKLNEVNSFSVCSGDTKLSSSKTVQYLGVKLDEPLSGDEITRDIISKASAWLKFIYRQANCLNMASRKLLCSSLIMCHFDYASSMWYSSLSFFTNTDSRQCKTKLYVSF